MELVPVTGRSFVVVAINWRTSTALFGFVQVSLQNRRVSGVGSKSHSSSPFLPHLRSAWTLMAATVIAASEALIREEESKVAVLQNRMIAAIRAKPAKARQLWSLFEDVGITEKNANVLEPLPQVSKQRNSQLLRKQSLKEKKEEMKALSLLSAKASGAKEPVDADITVVAKLKVPQLKTLLCRLSPTVCSMGNLSQHARSLAKSGFVALFEFGTGLSPDDPVQPNVQCFSIWTAQLQKDCRLRGDRLTRIALPPAWAEHGLYRLVSASNESVQVQHRFTKETVTVGVASILKRTLKEESELTVADFHIVKNWSERGATLARTGSAKGYLLAASFPEQLVSAESVASTPSPTKRRRIGSKTSPSTASKGADADVAALATALQEAMKQEPPSPPQGAPPVGFTEEDDFCE
eukprot:5620054-Amphidinium_carterae.1